MSDLTAVDFSLVRGGLLYRAQRMLGLIPASGSLGVKRRLLILTGVAWLPLVLGAALDGRLYGDGVTEPLLQQFAIHARCLVAIPLLIAAEALAERGLPALVGNFVHSRIVTPEQLPSFQAALSAAARIRDSLGGTALILGVVLLAVTTGATSTERADEVSWAVHAEGEQTRLAFAGAWYLFVSRALFAMLAAQWLWRVRVLFALFARIARLELALPASHPDRAAGLGFLDEVPLLLAPVVLALSVVIASRLAHDVLFHGMHVLGLRPIAVVWIVFGLLFCVFPLLPLALRLVRMRRAALLQYGALLGRHAQLFEQRWLGTRTPNDENLLGAPDVSAVADAYAVYDAVEKLRPLPVPLRALVPVALAAALPFVPVFAIEIPLQDLLKRILSALV
ncbi:MAG TPA: hypothetical protein VFT98_08405 [Myxococcota bacterium]|nr:hypothetical protein [Myxococcota bacterium]